MKHEETTRRILTIPNLLSFFRLCLIPVFAWLYCVQKEYIWTGIVLVISGLTDTADGLIARHFHMTSDLGKVLDPACHHGGKRNLHGHHRTSGDTEDGQRVRG